MALADDSRELVHWFSRGGGTTTVLLHGFTGDAGSFDRLGAPRSESVCALHLPGHHSAATVGSGFADSIDWVRTTLRSEGIERARLVGYSLGARVALAVAVSDAALCDSLVLVSGHPGLEAPEARRTRRAADARWIRLLRGEGIAAFVDAWEALSLWDSQQAVSAAQRDTQRRRRLAHRAEGLAGSLETMGLGQMPPLGSALGALRMPVSLVVGSLDTKFVGIAQALARRHAHIPIHVIERTGHNVVLEAPAQLASLIWPR